MLVRRTTLFVAAALAPMLSGAQTQYSVGSNSGLQLQFGPGLMVPLQPPTSGPTMQPVGTGTGFPPLLVPPASGAHVLQSAGPWPQQVVLPAGVFRRAGQVVSMGVAAYQPTLWFAETSFDFSAPAGAPATFSAGGRTGAATTTFVGASPGSKIQYSKTVSQFGGPAPVGLSGRARFWDPPPGASIPCKHPAFGGTDADCMAQVHAWRPGGRAGQGAGTGFTTASSPTPQQSPVVALSVPGANTWQSTTLAATGAGNNAHASTGFPWTTGRVRASQPGALGTPDVFTITGMDSRSAGGAGTLSLVSGSLGRRAITGPESNRGWMRLVLPEPDAIAGLAAGLLGLAACRVRRRQDVRPT